MSRCRSLRVAFWVGSSSGWGSVSLLLEGRSILLATGHRPLSHLQERGVLCGPYPGAQLRRPMGNFGGSHGNVAFASTRSLSFRKGSRGRARGLFSSAQAARTSGSRCSTRGAHSSSSGSSVLRLQPAAQEYQWCPSQRNGRSAIEFRRVCSLVLGPPIPWGNGHPRLSGSPPITSLVPR